MPVLGITVTVIVPVAPFAPLAVIVTVPLLLPVITPVVASTRATFGLLLVYVTPVSGFARGVMLPPARMVGMVALPLLPLPMPVGTVSMIVTGFTVSV